MYRVVDKGGGGSSPQSPPLAINVIIRGEELLSSDENGKYTVKRNTSGGVCVHCWGISTLYMMASGIVPDISKLCLIAIIYCRGFIVLIMCSVSSPHSYNPE